MLLQTLDMDPHRVTHLGGGNGTSLLSTAEALRESSKMLPELEKSEKLEIVTGRAPYLNEAPNPRPCIP